MEENSKQPEEQKELSSDFELPQGYLDEEDYLEAMSIPKYSKEYVIDFDNLYEAMFKCRLGVSWKPSVMAFLLNAEEDVMSMHEKLTSGTWKNGTPKSISITFPKKREGLSIPFRDRVYQRSLNDNVLYQLMARTFIYDNAACQTGKGTDFARKRIKRHLWKHYTHYGNLGWVIQIDIHGYYPNMNHTEVKKCFKKYLPPDVYKMTCDILDHQYKGDVGYNPGSQMVQIAGIALLNQLDHMIKEELHCHFYIRYMDDFWILLPYDDYERVQNVLAFIVDYLYEMGFEVNSDKTHIRPLTKGFRFLGYDYRITATGKIIMTRDPDNVRHERKKLVREVHRAAKGDMTVAKIKEGYRSYRDSASRGNCTKLLQKLDAFMQEQLRLHKAEIKKAERLREEAQADQVIIVDEYGIELKEDVAIIDTDALREAGNMDFTGHSLYGEMDRYIPSEGEESSTPLMDFYLHL